MKLYGRLIKTLATSPFKERVSPLDTVVTQWRVLPGDLDVFGHMNNGRYNMVMDIARLDFIARLGMLGRVWKHRWIVPVGSAQLDFRRALKPFARYDIHTRLCYWDEHWFYFKQEFMLPGEPPKCAATGYVKAVFKDARGLVPSQRVIAEVGQALGQDMALQRPDLDGVLARKFDLAVSGVPARDAHTQSISERPEQKAAPVEQREPIAIVGIGCRFPGGVENPDDFWNMLKAGKDCIVDIPESRWDPRKFYDPSGKVPGKAYVNRAGILNQNIDAFDPAFFGIAPREAEILDPMQRLLLEVSWEAFEHAGIPADSWAGKNMAVYVGGFVVDAMIQQYSPLNRQRLGPQSATACSLTLLANRLSYFYDLRGPSVSLDTACSSSLVAVHQACQSIWSGESEAALVGGVNMLLTPETQVSMCKGQFLSPNGRCNTFGAGADGYVRGEGAAMVVLKPLSQALADGNEVVAVIKGTAANQDGRTHGITVPNGEAQMAAMHTALRQAGLQPHQVDYMEAHGTGTPVGDPIEANALGTVLGKGRSGAHPCPIGSLKTNVGHMEACAGIGGLIKAALVLKHRTLVPHLHLDEVNPEIDLPALKLRVPTQVEALAAGQTLYAGVNSFGYGGTNAHAILASPPPVKPIEEREGKQGTTLSLVLSAASEGALRSRAAQVQALLADDACDMQRLSTALATQRSHLSQRMWLSGQSRAALQEQLRQVAAGQHDARIVRGEAQPGRVLFVYTGMGPQWWAMGRELYESEPVYRAAIDECDAAFCKVAEWSLREAMLADESDSHMHKTEVAQPANLAVQVALTRLLQSWGVQADALVGHSIGEVGAAWASGGLDLETAFRVAYHRSRLQARTAGKGGMLAVGLTADAARERLTGCADKVAIAAINGPGSVTLAGDLPRLETLAAELENEQVFCKFLKVEVPYHSPVMQEIEEDLRRALHGLPLAAMHTPLYSTVTGARMQGGHDAEYWWRNVRQTVLFQQAMQEAMQDGCTTVVEIGPHPVLASAIKETARQADKRLVHAPSLIRQQPEADTLRALLGQLFCAGVNMDWSVYFGRCARLALPAYPWDRAIYRDEGTRARNYRLPHFGHPLVTRTTRVPETAWHIDLNAHALPFVQDHEVAGSVLFPGAGYVELGLAMAAQTLPHDRARAIMLEHIAFEHPAVVRQDEHASLVATVHGEPGHVLVHYARAEQDAVRCARMHFSSGPSRLEAPALAEREAEFGAAEIWESDQLYAALARKGLCYGPGFRAATTIRLLDRAVLARIELPKALDAAGYSLHPVLLDAALHSLIAAAPDEHDFSVIPQGIDAFYWLGEAGTALVAYGRITQLSESSLRGDIDLYDAQGQCCARVRGLRCRLFRTAAGERMQTMAPWFTRKTWQALNPPEGLLEVADADRAATDTLVITNPQGKGEIGVQHSNGDTPLSPLKDSSNASLRQRVQAMVAQGKDVVVLDLRCLHAPEAMPESLLDIASHQCLQVLHTLQALRDIRLRRYVLFTREVQRIHAGDCPRLTQSLAEGLSRTVMTECPSLHVTLVDIDRELQVPEHWRPIMAWLAAFPEEQELALRGDTMHALRLNPYTLTPVEQNIEWCDASEVDAYVMRQYQTGKIESIDYETLAMPEPADHEVVVEMHTSSLHFKDLMKVLGLLSEDALQNTYYRDTIGMEGSGTVLRTGSSVTKVKPGDRVYVWGSVMRSHLCVTEHELVRLPDAISLADAANLVTYFTVYHSFVNVARLRAGGRILVHSAAGGIGLAAIHLARHLGLQVFATAGSDAKRQALQALDVAMVGDSRSVDFVEQVQRWTEGKGVQAVLNFTPGEIMRKSVHCLAPGGHFIELGKQSFERHESLPLRPFMENLNYSSVDFDRLTRQQPEIMLSIVDRVLQLMVEGAIPPLPCQAFPLAQTREAFRVMARGDYVGKLALRHDTAGLRVRRHTSGYLFKRDGSYLITGGLGGFGLQTAQWMSEQGAGHLILLSRRGAHSDEARKAIAVMTARGTRVSVRAVDVADFEALQTAVTDALKEQPPLCGVMHAAMVLDDRMMQDLDAESLATSVNAKARGAWHLHRITQQQPLDFMVLFSSISALVGNAGQANYVAANNFLDQLAHYRHALGLPCLSINWGVFEDTGVVARNGQLARHLSHMGIRPFRSRDALAALALALTQDTAQMGVMDVDWSRFATASSEGGGAQRFATLAAQSAEQGSGGTQQSELQARFGGLDADARKAQVRQALFASVAQVMRLDVAQLQASSKLRDLGLDSLMAVEIDVEFSSRTGLDIPNADIAAGPSLEELERSLLKRLNAQVDLPKEEAATMQ